MADWLAKVKVQKRRIKEKVLQATGIAHGSEVDDEFKRNEEAFHMLER